MNDDQNNKSSQLIPQMKRYLLKDAKLEELYRLSLKWIVAGIVTIVLGMAGLKFFTVSLGDFTLFSSLLVLGVGALFVGGTRLIEALIEVRLKSSPRI